MYFSLAAVALGFLGSVSAHATFQEMWINGVDVGSSCVRLPLSNNPVTNVTSNDIACNVNATPSEGICTIKPGDSITVEMHQQPGDRSCANQAIGGDHYGPLLIYMAPVTDATTAVGSSASWFKISEIGLESSNPDYWGTETLNDNCGHYTFTIPSVAPGNYLLRAEVIALHVASSVGGAQFYMSCYQVAVSGSGTAKPSAVKLPGAYSATDPGILIDIYTQLNAYVIPGPTIYNLPSPTVATTAYPTTATWNTANQPTAVPTSYSGLIVETPTGTGTASGATQTQYGQCGGTGYTGPTACASPFTCVAVSPPYYYQCQ